MARPLRIEKPGGWYHVSARGNERKAIYRDNRDRRPFLEVIAELVDRFRVRLHGFVLMDNHYHLMLELSEANLSRAVQWLNVSYSVWFNRRHGRSGHLFQGRFKSVAVSPEEWALELSRYVHLNPVRIQGSERPNGWNARPCWDWGADLKWSRGGGIGITWQRRCGRDWRKARGNRCRSRSCWAAPSFWRD
jgi:REP element-mobilizing transposase RayT